MSSEGAPEKQGRSEPWKPGQSGNPLGRPKGSRNKLGEAFIEALHNDFQEHGVAAIQKVRDKKPDAYLKVIASLLPKEIKIEATNDLSDAELDKRIRQLAAILGAEVRTPEPSSGEEAAVRH